jgi:hypothetical protein
MIIFEACSLPSNTKKIIQELMYIANYACPQAPQIFKAWNIGGR